MKLLFLKLLLVVLCLLPSSVRADAPAPPTVQVRSHTLFRLRQARTALDGIHTWSPLTQTFSIAVAERDRHPRVRFYSNFRVGGDFSAGVGRASILSTYVDLAAARGAVRVRLGRQTRNQGVGGFTRFDGISLRLAARHLALEGWVGAGLSSTVIVEDGEVDEDYGERWVTGAELSLIGFASAQLSVGVEAEGARSQLARSRFYADFAHAIGEPLLIRFSADADIGLRRLSYLLGGIELHPLRQLHIALEVEHFKPRFELGSLYNVFAVDPYWEGRLRVNARPLPFLAVHGRVGVQGFPEALDEEGASLEVGDAVVDWGAGVRVRIRDRGRISFDYRQSDGYLGGKLLLGLRGGLDIGPASIDLTAQLQDYDFSLQPTLSGLSFAGVADVKVRMGNWGRVWVRGVGVADHLLERNLRLTAGVDLILGNRTVRRAADESALQWQPALASLAGRAAGPGSHR